MSQRPTPPGFFERLRNEALALIGLIAPEFAGRGLRFVHFNEIGLSSEGLLAGLSFRDVGTGPEIAIDHRRIVRFVSDERRGAPAWRIRAQVRQIYLGCALHELAHIVVDDADGVPLECCHALPFIRVALHLHFRARIPGLGPYNVVDTAGYQLSPVETYVQALGDEPQQLALETFATIKTIPPPLALAKLWERDTAIYHLREGKIPKWQRPHLNASIPISPPAPPIGRQAIASW
jgi:hypothetical protein